MQQLRHHPLLKRIRLVAVNVFIVAFLAVIVIDGFPTVHLLHTYAKVWIDPLIDVTGLWQGGWSVFAPQIDRQNHHVEVHIEYEDGSTAHWRSPHWSRLSALEKLRQFRVMEYTEQLNMRSNAAIRPHFARYLARELQPASGVAARSVTINYHYADIWPPVDGDYQPLPTHEGHWFVTPLYEGLPP